MVRKEQAHRYIDGARWQAPGLIRRADLDLHPVSAPERYWQNGEWWKGREGRKLWFTETIKTIADYLRI